MKKIFLFIFLFFVFAVTSLHAGDISFNPGEIKLKLKEKEVIKYFDLSSGSGNIGTGRNTELSFSQKIHQPVNTPRKIKQYKADPIKLTILGVVGAGVFTGFHIYYSNTWWKDQRDDFKYAADGYYARNMDKASHIYTANIFTVATSAAYEWAGIAPGKALLYGALTSFAYETYIEINDGFAPNWGFDWGDVGANVFGAA